MNNSPSKITELKPNEVFVFGSNLAGIHGAGAARLAKEKWGARQYQGVGLTSTQTYAIPTKDHHIETMLIQDIAPFVREFIIFALHNPNLIFLVTEIGCGLAGYRPKDIAPLFKEALSVENIHLPKRFTDIL